MISRRTLIFDVILLHFVSAIEFRDYKLYDPENRTNEDVYVKGIAAVYVDSLKEYSVTLPPDSGKPEAFQIAVLGRPGPIRIVRNHTKGSAHGVHLVYAKVDRNSKVEQVYDVGEGKTGGTPIKCEKSDMLDRKEQLRCVAIASGWMSTQLPSELYVFQHVVHSQLQAFHTRDTIVFYMLREDGTDVPKIEFTEDATVNVWYDFGVEFGKNGKKNLTLSSLSSSTTKFGKKFAIIGELKLIAQEATARPDDVDIEMRKLDDFLLLKRRENADEARCQNEYVTIGTKRITFGELTDTIIVERNMDETWRANLKCFAVDMQDATVQKLTGSMDTPISNREIIKYEVKAAQHESFYAVAIAYKKEFDNAKLGHHHFAVVNSMVFHLEDLRHTGEVVYQLDKPTEVVQFFRNTPAIQITVHGYEHAFKLFPYWMDQRMTHMEYEPLHNYYEGISYGGRKFAADNIWAGIIISKEQCINSSLLKISLVEHHLEDREINGTIKHVERDMAEAYEEYEDLHVDLRNPCNDINVLSQIKRTMRKVSKHDEVVLETTNEEPLSVTLNLEEDEKFLLRFSTVEREESKCHDLDTVAIFLKDGMITNEKAYIRTFTYEALRTRSKNWVGTGKLTIAIPNGCFKVDIVSTFSLQRANNLRILRKCLIVMGMTILMSGTFIFIYYKFSLAGKEYRRLRRMYRRAKRNGNLERHYLHWKENVEEILVQWEKITDDN